MCLRVGVQRGAKSMRAAPPLVCSNVPQITGTSIANPACLSCPATRKAEKECEFVWGAKCLIGRDVGAPTIPKLLSGKFRELWIPVICSEERATRKGIQRGQP